MNKQMSNKNAAYYRDKINPKLADLPSTSQERIRIADLLYAVETIEPPDIEETGPEPKPGDQSIRDIADGIQLDQLSNTPDADGLSLRGLVEELIAYGLSLE